MSLPDDIHVVFFDIGGPIYSDDTFLVASTTALQEIRTEQGRAPVVEADVRRIYDEIRNRPGSSFRLSFAERILGDIDLAPELARRTARTWHNPPEALYDDVLPLLRAIHGRVRIGVVANPERGAVEALQRDGVAPYIDIWGVSALVGFAKPSRELYDWAMAQAGTSAEHAVHVGNRLDNDVRPAKALGLSTVWVMRGEAPDHPTEAQMAEADLAVPDLTTLAVQLLPRLGRPG